MATLDLPQPRKPLKPLNPKPLYRSLIEPLWIPFKEDLFCANLEYEKPPAPPRKCVSRSPPWELSPGGALGFVRELELVVVVVVVVVVVTPTVCPHQSCTNYCYSSTAGGKRWGVMVRTQLVKTAGTACCKSHRNLGFRLRV